MIILVHKFNKLSLGDTCGKNMEVEVQCGLKDERNICVSVRKVQGHIPRWRIKYKEDDNKKNVTPGIKVCTGIN